MHHRHSAQSIAVSLASRLIVKNAVRVWAIQPDLHWPLEAVDLLAGLLPRHGPSAEIERVELDNCAAEWIRSAGASSDRVILYLHGGAFFTCGLNTHRSFVTHLSKAADASVLNVGYRLLPSHQICDAIDDGISAVAWLRRRGYDGDRIVIAGDSAGGYLAFMTALSAIKNQVAKPAGVATISPFTDPDPARKLGHRNARRCSMFTRRALSVFDRYLRQAQLWERSDDVLGCAVSPVDADLSRLPPVAIHASSDELLRPDAELMAQRLGNAGVRCDLHLWDGQIHDFPLAADVLPEGRRAIRYIGDFVKEVTAKTGELRGRRERASRGQKRRTRYRGGLAPLAASWPRRAASHATC
ncbi:alpha/beta hydrolase [Candidatus Mycobacterium methanotrophicum]|uniref:Alpha/beta hydrolase n=1 Tax=Candidatus Mycobacterium methanotrophicum TaxID=2943498 RepID=A0ABY4QN00_9MYCO|nr:alpha/beta hydrolase [Candidatus Mycobacterium methanotrophicum]UQX12358.1 alpha/beta hydrolase [Candidatus Mycobacterium methanotrophicum]